MRRAPIVVLSLAIVAAGVVASPVSTAAARADGTIRLKVMTFNIREGGVHGQFSKVVEAITAADADVVGLQEPFGRTRKLARALGWYAATAPPHDLAVPDPAARGERRLLGLAPGRAGQGRHDREHPQPVVSLHRQHDAVGHGHQGRDPADRAPRPDPVDAAVPGFACPATRSGRPGLLHRRLQRPVVARLDARGGRRARVATDDPPLPGAAVLGPLADLRRDGEGGLPRFVPRGPPRRDRRSRDSRGRRATPASHRGTCSTGSTSSGRPVPPRPCRAVSSATTTPCRTSWSSRGPRITGRS